ncbi:MAG: F0F1 ATP synthase subunit delta [Novosphingobium sp.]|nr:F0F1 ATP synthase subunit delta [Novosphingobium sp.]
MRIDWWTLGLQAINLLVLVWILSRFLFRPIARIVAERQAAADRILEEARAAKDKAEAAGQEAKLAADEAAAARSGMIAAATREADKEKETLLAAARAEAGRLRDMAHKEAERIRADEAARAGDWASRLAVDIAARLFERLPQDARIAGFIDGLADGLRQLPENTRGEFGADGEAIALKAPRALSAEEEGAIRTALSKALGRDATLAVTVDPGLIAGLEIETRHAAVHNSFRNDLDRIAATLTRDRNGNG